MNNFDLTNRRALLTGAAAMAAAGALGFTADALAKAPPVNKPAPGFYRFKVGAFEVTVVSDGPLNLGPPSGEVFKGLSKEKMTHILSNNFLPTDNVALEQNTVVVNTGKHLVLFDTGTGPAVKAFGPNAGHQLANLKAAGIDPKSVDVIALTHAHADHCFGIMTEAGKRNFPKAQIYMAQNELEFWTDESKAGNDMMKMMVGGARKNLLPNRDRMVYVKDGQEIVPGIQAMLTPGHTVGHVSYVITSQGQSLLNTGDVCHHHIISTEKPRVPLSFDTDGAQGVASRLKVFDMASSTRTPIVAYHFPWPGVGFIAKQGDACRYFATPLRTVL